ncbi:MAG: thrombospondin type 3 repeat-containing protein [Ferruginibacter sp.]|nr:thrombospondin type 3 repeat-containing protein [Ferruginibacter sp.]
MKHPIQSIAFTVALFLAGISSARAQSGAAKWQVGINGGMLIYQGDLTPSDMGSYQTAQPVFGLYVSRVLNPSFLLRTNLAVGKLYGNDAKYDSPIWRKERNYKFTSPIAEISELLVWNMFDNNGNELGKKFSPYAFGGLGVTFLRIKRDTSNFNTHYFAAATNLVNGLAADLSRMPPRAILVAPMGLGVEFNLTDRLSLTAETSFRLTFTDYLDGFSFGANPNKKDFYHSHTIGLLYRFGKSNSLGCPVIVR